MSSFLKGKKLYLLSARQVNFDTFKDSVLDEITKQSISHHIGEREALSSHSLRFCKEQIVPDRFNFLLQEIDSLYRHLKSRICNLSELQKGF